MRKIFRRAWEDIKRGESIDAYVAIILAFILTIMGILDILPANWLNSVTIAILALLSATILGNRFRLDDIRRNLYSKGGDLKQVYSNNLPESWKVATDVWLVGVTLNRTIKEQYTLIEDILRNGGRVHVLIRHPQGRSNWLIPQHSYQPIMEEDVKPQLLLTLNRLKKLKDIFPDRLEVKVLDHHYSIGINGFDVDKPYGKLFIEYYPFKMPDNSAPKIELSAEDGYWYTFYRNQLKAMWENAQVYQE